MLGSSWVEKVGLLRNVLWLPNLAARLAHQIVPLYVVNGHAEVISGHHGLPAVTGPRNTLRIPMWSLSEELLFIV